MGFYGVYPVSGKHPEKYEQIWKDPRHFHWAMASMSQTLRHSQPGNPASGSRVACFHKEIQARDRCVWKVWTVNPNGGKSAIFRSNHEDQSIHFSKN